MFSVSSWKVSQTPLLPILWARSDLTPARGTSLSSDECGEKTGVMAPLAGRRVQAQAELWGHRLRGYRMGERGLVGVVPGQE